jgi:hypothetical protein
MDSSTFDYSAGVSAHLMYFGVAIASCSICVGLLNAAAMTE